MTHEPLPDGFALFCLVAGLFSGLMTFLLLSIGRRIYREKEPK